MERHLSQCERCSAELESHRALRSALAFGSLYFEVPQHLEKRVRAELAKAAKVSKGVPVPGWRGLAAAASLAAMAVLAWALIAIPGAPSREALLDREIVAAHVRSLMADHLTDVPSTDQHTVKPWFNGRLDFSPPVHDFAGRGYPLLGGRLDYLHGREVAALVYGRRQHIINVFLWPEGGPRDEPAPVLRQGYHLLHWTTPEYTYWVASDLGLSELTEFAKLVQLGDSAATAADTQRRD
jgi:anti-sigma factor RsiW